jgi:hypothetical protein
MLSPATGSKLYIDTWTSGLAYESLGGRPLEQHQLGGSYIVASRHPKPWQKQWNLLIAYLFFYNPLRFFWALFRPKNRRLWVTDALMQVFGMIGLLQTVRRTAGWGHRLKRERIGRATAPPTSRLPMRSAAGDAASHALPGTPAAAPKRLVQLEPVGAP